MLAANCRLRTNVFAKPLTKFFRYLLNPPRPVAATQLQGRHITMATEKSSQTKILPIEPTKIKTNIAPLNISGSTADRYLDGQDNGNEDFKNLQLAAHALRTSDIPVAFPTETVYGLGADATRSTAVKGIYNAKQ